MNILKTALGACWCVLFLCCKKETPNMVPTVNAGKDSTFTSSVDTLHLSGAAVDSDGNIVSYLWSQVSGPNTATIAAPGSATTYATNIVAGKYVFQLMATDNVGAIGVKSVTLTVQQPQVYTATILMNQNPVEALLAVSYQGNRTDIAPPELSAAAWTSGGSPAYTRGIIKFDFSVLPAGAKITSAKLSLYSNPTPLNGDLVNANYGTNNSMLVQRVTAPWVNSTITWNNQPASNATNQVIVPHTNASRLDVVDLEVTNMVKEMALTGNNGFMLKLQNESGMNTRIFCSSRYTDATKRPKLVIQYTR